MQIQLGLHINQGRNGWVWRRPVWQTRSAASALWCSVRSSACSHLSDGAERLLGAQVTTASSDDGSSRTTNVLINDLGEAQRWAEPLAELLGYSGRWVVQPWERLGWAAGLGW